MKKSTKVERWCFHSEPRFRLEFSIEAQPEHVAVKINDMGYSESSKLGLDASGTADEMRRYAAAFREFADTLEAACRSAEGKS